MNGTLRLQIPAGQAGKRLDQALALLHPEITRSQWQQWIEAGRVQLDGALPRNLFFYFIDNPLVTRDDIFGTFWPTLSIKEATNVFHVTKRKISERITMKVEESGNYELTQYSSGFYMPGDKVVRHYDAGDFQDAVEKAATTMDEREEELLVRGEAFPRRGVQRLRRTRPYPDVRKPRRGHRHARSQRTRRPDAVRLRPRDRRLL